MKITLRNTCLTLLIGSLFTISSGAYQGSDNPDDLLNLYLETGSYEFVEAIRDGFPGSSYVKFCEAWEYIGANNEKTKELALALVEDDPEFAAGHFVLGTVLANGFKDYTEAVNQYNLSLDLNPEFAPAYLNRGIAKLNLLDYQGAREDFNRVLKLKRGYAEAYLWRGTANHALGDDDAMKADFEIGLQMDFMALSKISNKMAVEAINKAIEVSPDNAIYYYARGYSYFVKENYRSAAADFSKLIQMVPGSSDFYKYSGASKMYLDDYEGAQKDLNFALSVNPDDPEIYYFLAVLMSDFLKQPAMASEYMNNAIELDGFNALYFYLRSKSAFKMMNLSDALDDVNSAIQLDHRKGDYYALRGNIKMKMGNPPEDFCPDFKKAQEWGTSYNLKRVMKKSCNE